MNDTILFIDGENFLNKVKDILRKEKVRKDAVDLSNINLLNLFKDPLKNFKIGKKLFYAARLREYKETLEKSKKLIKSQRVLKTNLEKQGFDFVIAGNVRAQKVFGDGKVRIIFKEKGVDVRIAVDLVAWACDGLLGKAILCSSDSDLQPAVQELKKRKVEIVYLGFESDPNLGLKYTADKTILLKNREVLRSLKNSRRTK